MVPRSPASRHRVEHVTEPRNSAHTLQGGHMSPVGTTLRGPSRRRSLCDWDDLCLGETQTGRGVARGRPVGARWLGRAVLFRNEVRRWLSGVIPDVAAVVSSPQLLSSNPRQAAWLSSSWTTSPHAPGVATNCCARATCGTPTPCSRGCWSGATIPLSASVHPCMVEHLAGRLGWSSPHVSRRWMGRVLGPLVPCTGDCKPCVGTASSATMEGHERSHDEP